MMHSSLFDDFRNAWNKPNNAPAQLILINVIVFLFLALLYVITYVTGMEVIFSAIYDQFSIPPLFSDFITRPWTLITYAFAHSLRGLMHILFNMLVFFWFSRLIQEFLGNNRVISLYVLGALAGAVAYLLAYNFIPVYHEAAPGVNGMVGASAAVYATVIGAAVFLPNYTFFLLFFGPVKIKYIAAVYVVISLLGSVGQNAGGNIAHLGGALMGWLFIAQLRKGNDIGAWVIHSLAFFRSFFVSTPKIKVTHRAETKKPSEKAKPESSKKDNLSKQEEIDAILDKISQSGYESLSKEEKQKLFNASKH
ncbi:MAG: rhomboid family intramembrane serine protease [Cyclobacteriaceae bacterium]|nr:rhomboid family intramembrane serine protease [Cyclobacteriaceae bacterium]